MSKWYLVEAKAFHSYLIEVEDDQDEDVVNEFFKDEHLSDYDEWEVKPVPDQEVDCEKRHATQVYGL